MRIRIASQAEAVEWVKSGGIAGEARRVLRARSTSSKPARARPFCRRAGGAGARTSRSVHRRTRGGTRRTGRASDDVAGDVLVAALGDVGLRAVALADVEAQRRALGQVELGDLVDVLGALGHEPLHGDPALGVLRADARVGVHLVELRRVDLDVRAARLCQLRDPGADDLRRVGDEVEHVGVHVARALLRPERGDQRRARQSEEHPAGPQRAHPPRRRVRLVRRPAFDLAFVLNHLT